MNLMCDYCQAKLEGVEYKAKRRTKQAFNTLLEENDGSVSKARNAITDRKHAFCTCNELLLKLQCSTSIQSSCTQNELNSMLQNILIANANKGSSKHTIVSLLNRTLLQSDITRCCQRLNKVQEIDLSDCQFKELPASFGEIFVQVRTLNLSRNLLSDLPSTISNCLHLNRINLSRNCFTCLPKFFSKLPRLEHVETSYNNIESTLLDVRNEFTKKNSIVENECSDDSSKNWVAKRDAHRDRIVYFNVKSGEVMLNDISKKKVQSNKTKQRADKTTLKHLRTICIDNNKLHKFPDVIVRMLNLSELNLQNNKLTSLPDDLNRLVKLTVLDVSHNQLTQMPDLKLCTDMKELNFASNKINEFPPCILVMKKLNSLKMHCNQIKQIPYELGFLEQLACLTSHNNPIIDPSFGVLNQNTNQLLWECRQLHWNRQKGDAPRMITHESGIENQRFSLVPDFDHYIQEKVREADTKGTTLELQHSNLTTIPNIIYGYDCISKIDLRNNQIDILEWRVRAPNITYLNLSGCQLQCVSETVSNLSGLESLNLERNYITQLPTAFVELTGLKLLFLNNNRIGSLPMDLGNLKNLVELHICHNFLQCLPDSIGCMSDLTIIAASHNRLRTLPPIVLENTKLKTLNLRQNSISHLPPLGTLSLTHLLLSNNKIECLDHNIFSPNATTSINHLELNGNRLRVLPHDFPRCNHLNVDMNPLVSPPLSLANEGSGAIADYCNLRCANINQFCKGLKKNGFKTSLEKFRPPIRNVIDNTSYLLPSDLLEFDHKIDECVNGLFFYNEFSVKQIVNDIAHLRNQRLKETEKQILDHIIIELKSFQGGIFRNDIEKKFGLFGNKVKCYAIPLKEIVLSVNNPSSIFQKVKDSLQRLDSLFSFDNSMLKDALNFKSPFGLVASIENVTYQCEKDERTLQSLVIAQHIYSEEEAARKEQEEQLLFFHFEKMECRVDDWASTKYGIRSTNAEISQRIKKITKVFSEAKRDLRRFRCESEDKVKIMERRLADYNQNQPYDFHFIANEDAAEKLRVALQKTKMENCKNIEEMEKRFFDAKARMEQDNRRINIRNQAIADMKAKCCCHVFKKVYSNGRAYALSNNLQRPWDSEFNRNHQQMERSYLPLPKLIENLDSIVESMDFVWTNMVDMKQNQVYNRFQSRTITIRSNA